MSRRRHRDLDCWRVLAHDDGHPTALKVSHSAEFDELVIGTGKDCWFHIERMDTNAFWMRVGEENFDIVLRPGKTPNATISHRKMGLLTGGK